MSFGNPKRDFQRRFEHLRDRKFGRVVRGPYAVQRALNVDPASPGNPTTGQTWVVDLLIIGIDRVVMGVPLAGINHKTQYANVGGLVAVETIRGALSVTGRAEFDLDQGSTLCYDDNGVLLSTTGLGTTCSQFTLGQLGTVPSGGFGTTSLQPTICVDAQGVQTVLG